MPTDSEIWIRPSWMRKALSGVAVCATTVALSACVGTPPADEKTPQVVLPGAAPAGATSLNDRLFPYVGNTGYDAVNYELFYEYDPDTPVMRGRVVMAATALEELSTFSLDSAVASVAKVLVNGNAAEYRSGGEKLVVALGDSVPAGTAFTVETHFTADRSKTPLSPLASPHDAEGLQPWVTWDNGFALFGQPDRSHVFFPMNDHPSDKATVTTHVTTPDTLAVAANGTEIKRTKNQDGTATTTFTTRDPIATEVLQVAVGDLVRVQDEADGVPLVSYIPAGSEKKFRDYLDLVPKHVKWMTEQVGPYYYERYGILVLPRDYQGVALETATMSTYGDLAGSSVADTDDVMLHETAHQWFGDTVSPATWDDMWLSEGHASFYGMLYQLEQGHADLDNTFRRAYEYDLENRAITGPPTQLREARDVLGSTNAPGVALLYALRAQVGTETFQEIERTFLKNYAHKSATTADYVDTASRVTGQDLNHFFASWLASETTPEMPGRPDWSTPDNR